MATWQDWFNYPQAKDGKPVTGAAKMNYAAGAGMSALQIAGLAVGNLQNNKKELAAMEAEQVSSTSKLNLTNQLQAYTPIELGRENAFAKGLAGAASGASAGVAAGGVGAIVGGLVGGVTGVLGSLSRNKQNQATENRLRMDTMNNFMAENQRLSQQSLNNALINYAAYGGQLNQAATPESGLVEINNGGTHEQNPLGGVPFGIGANGKQNFVEQGETAHDGYIFSKRLALPEALSQPLGLSPKFGNKPFADIAKAISKESNERPYDPISNLTKKTLLNRLSQAQDITKQLTISDTSSKPMQDGNYFASGGAPQQTGNPALVSILGGVMGAPLGPWGAVGGVALANALYQLVAPRKSTDLPYTINPNTTPLRPQMTTLPGLNTPLGPTIAQQTVSQVTKPVKKAHTKGPASTSTISPLGAEQPVTSRPQELYFPRFNANFKLNKSEPTFQKYISQGGGTGPQLQTDVTKSNFGDLGMFAPAIGNLATMLGYATTPAETMKIPRLSAGTPLNEYAPYTPIDQTYIANQLKQQSGGVRRGIMDLAGGNRGAATAGLIASDQNYLGALADSYLKASEYNRNQQMQNLQFTNQARQVNNQMGLQTQAYNQQAALQEYQINAANRAARRAGIMGGIQAIGSNIGEMSRYNKNLRTIRNAYMYTDQGELIGQ